MKSNTIVVNGKNNLDVEVVTIGEENTVIQVLYSGICGTDLHLISKFNKTDVPFSIGHEFVGKIYKNPPEGFYIGEEKVVTSVYIVRNIKIAIYVLIEFHTE